MSEIWIVGAGRFGLLALERLSKMQDGTRFGLIDPDIGDSDMAGHEFVCLDGVDFLNQNLVPGKGPDWIIPALPVHLAAEWVMVRMGPGRLSPVDLPPKIDSCLPNPMRGQGKDIYVSHATFRCPDNCTEPDETCTVTKKPRMRNMYEILEEITFPPFKSLVAVSRQLGPGVGGYRPKQLFKILDEVKQAKAGILVSTACRCHGVLTGFKIKDGEK